MYRTCVLIEVNIIIIPIIQNANNKVDFSTLVIFLWLYTVLLGGFQCEWTLKVQLFLFVIVWFN